MKDLVGKFLLLTLSVLVLIIAPIQSFSQEKSSENNIADLKSAIEKVLNETNTPAAGIAIVSKKSPVWITGLGKANIENDIHSSALEMANFVLFFLNRGALDTIQLMSEESILRMEISKSTPGARAGLELGYGLANFTSIHNEFVYQGHNGGMPGALSELAYLPQHGIGHVLFINSMNTFAFTQISKLIRDFETGAFKHDSIEIESGYSDDFTFRSGYYVPVNPRIEGGYFLDRLFDIYEFKKADNLLIQSWILPGGKNVYYPASDSKFRSGMSDKISLVKAMDPLEGEVLYTDSRVFKPISSFIVFGQLSVFILWMIMMVAGIFIWMIALIRFWTGRRSQALKVAQYPVMTSFMFFTASFLLIFSRKNHSDLLAEPGILSISLMGISVWFALSAVWSLVIIFKARKQKIAKLPFWSMAILSCLHLVVTIYLLWFGVIPVMTWT